MVRARFPQEFLRSLSDGLEHVERDPSAVGTVAARLGVSDEELRTFAGRWTSTALEVVSPTPAPVPLHSEGTAKRELAQARRLIRVLVDLSARETRGRPNDFIATLFEKFKGALSAPERLSALTVLHEEARRVLDECPAFMEPAATAVGPRAISTQSSPPLAALSRLLGSGISLVASNAESLNTTSTGVLREAMLEASLEPPLSGSGTAQTSAPPPLPNGSWDPLLSVAAALATHQELAEQLLATAEGLSADSAASEDGTGSDQDVSVVIRNVDRLVEQMATAAGLSRSMVIGALEFMAAPEVSIRQIVWQLAQGRDGRRRAASIGGRLDLRKWDVLVSTLSQFARATLPRLREYMDAREVRATSETKAAGEFYSFNSLERLWRTKTLAAIADRHVIAFVQLDSDASVVISSARRAVVERTERRFLKVAHHLGPALVQRESDMLEDGSIAKLTIDANDSFGMADWTRLFAHVPPKRRELPEMGKFVELLRRVDEILAHEEGPAGLLLDFAVASLEHDGELPWESALAIVNARAVSYRYRDMASGIEAIDVDVTSQTTESEAVVHLSPRIQSLGPRFREYFDAGGLALRIQVVCALVAFAESRLGRNVRVSRASLLEQMEHREELLWRTLRPVSARRRD